MNELNILDIKDLCYQRKIIWTEHVLMRLKERNIKRIDVKSCINTGTIIEQYPNDKPYTSCLILGNSINNEYLHVVCSIKDDLVCIITAYYPNTIKWENDFKTRKVVK